MGVSDIFQQELIFLRIDEVQNLFPKQLIPALEVFQLWRQCQSQTWSMTILSLFSLPCSSFSTLEWNVNVE